MADTIKTIQPEVIERIKQLKDDLGAVPLWTLEARHKLGKALLEAWKREDSSFAARYRTRLMDQLAKALGMDERVLNKHKQFAASFDEGELAHLAGVRMLKGKLEGKPLAWSHVRLLMEVEKKPKRRDLIEQAAAKGWTSARLGAAIHDLKGEKTRGGGPTPTKPSGLPDLVLQMNQFLSEWENRHEQVWSKEKYSLPKLVKATPKRRTKEKTIKELEALRVAWERAVKRSKEMVKAADQAIDRLHEEVTGAPSEA